MVTEELFPKRLEILKLLARRESEGRGPTIPEIAAAVNLRSYQTVHHHLSKLEQDGYIKREQGRPRTARLTARGWETAGRTPLLGRVAAGRGLEAVVVEDESFSLVSELLGSYSERPRHVLEAKGDSMTGAGIEEGDYLLVEENEDPPDGAVVVALLRGEDATVKRLYRDGGRIKLKPQNGEYEEIVVPVEDVTIQGRVIYVIHPPRRP